MEAIRICKEPRDGKASVAISLQQITVGPKRTEFQVTITVLLWQLQF